MKNFTTCICILGLSGIAFGDVLMDQIGPMDGTGVNGYGNASQDFETANDGYDCHVVDDFVGTGSNLVNAEMVMFGSETFVDLSGMNGVTVSLFSDTSVSDVSVVGDIGYQFVDIANVASSPDWAGGGFLLSMDVSVATIVGTQWAGIQTSNDYGTNGQTYNMQSASLNGATSRWSNPGGGFGAAPSDNVDADGNAADSAYRLSDGALPDPCMMPLNGICAADIDGDNVVAVGDLLALIGDWDIVGDGTFRPIGDISQDADGMTDCATNVSDLLYLITAWGEDCTVTGSCCHMDGSCMISDVTHCDGVGGVWTEGADCASVSCVAGACCIDDLNCSDYTAAACDTAGGAYNGDGTDCATTSCDSGCVAQGCQETDSDNGWVTSDANVAVGFRVADNFNPTVSGVIENVCWWGIGYDFTAQLPCSSEPNAFTITYYADSADGTVPGTEIASYAVTATAVLSGGGYDEMKYGASHAAVAVTAGECYWISIVNATTADCYWLWAAGLAGDERAAQGDMTSFAAIANDMAFCVDIDIDAGACGVHIGACCVEGVCTPDSTLNACTALAGVWLGNGSDCSAGCAGACCWPEQSACFEVDNEAVCAESFGVWRGVGSSCDDVSCEPVAGDECATALTVYDGANAFDTTAMTGTETVICEADAANWGWTDSTIRDGWYAWTCGASGMYQIDTCDLDSYDTNVLVYDACGGDALVCNGDKCSAGCDGTDCQQWGSELVLDATAGMTYIIRIGGYATADFGPGTLNINTYTETASACCMPDLTCVEELPSVCATNGGTSQAGMCADADCKDVSNCPAGEIEDCNGNCCPEGWVGDTYCDDGAYSHNGIAIFLNCAEFNCDGGDCTGCEDPVPAGCCMPDLTCQDLLPADCAAQGGASQAGMCVDTTCTAAAQGDECSYPLVASVGANTFDLNGMTGSQPQPYEDACTGPYAMQWSNSVDGWYEFVPSVSGMVTFDTCDGGSFDTSMVLYEDSCGNQVVCNGDVDSDPTGCQAYSSIIEYNCTAGTSYYIRIGGWGGDIGNGVGTLNIN